MTGLADHPTNHLDLIESELHRQQEAMGRKVSNTYTRASILVGAAGVLGGVGVGTATPLVAALPLLGSLLLFGVAAVLGIVALRPMKGLEVDLDLIVNETSKDTADELRRAIVESNRTSLRDYERTFGHRGRLITGGFTALALAIGVSSAAVLMGYLNPVQDQPVQVEIVKVP